MRVTVIPQASVGHLLKHLSELKRVARNCRRPTENDAERHRATSVTYGNETLTTTRRGHATYLIINASPISRFRQSRIIRRIFEELRPLPLVRDCAKADFEA